MTVPTREEYEIWLENPVTRFVMAGCERMARLQQEAFMQSAWNGNLDPVNHARCKVRADSYEGLATLSYENAMGANGLGEDGKELPA